MDRRTKILKATAFSTMGIIICLLAAGSIIEKTSGTDIAVRYVYTAPWTIALWAIAIVTALAYMFTIRLYRQWVTALLHFSFVIIMAGAITTHLFGESGVVHLRLDDASTETADAQSPTSSDLELPFDLQLVDFRVDYYPGTRAPMDFVSLVSADGTQAEISMNHIFRHRHYRFYQSGYDSDGQGVTLRVSHDPWGIGITYAGYALLLLSMLAFFLQKSTQWRALLRSPVLKTVLAAVFALSAVTASAKAPAPPTVDKQVAEAFCDLYVYYGDRVCPMQTLAKDFTTKLCGKSSYKGLSCEQVLLGWLFYYDQWAKEPMIKIKGSQTREMLGGKYVALNDFVRNGDYLLRKSLAARDKNAIAADEKFQLISMVCTAQMLKIYPIPTAADSITGERTLQWFSWVDHLPTDIDFADFQFAKGSMEYVSLCIAKNDIAEAVSSIGKIRARQIERAGTDNLPSDTRFAAEKRYNSLSRLVRPLAMATATFGIALFIIICLMLSNGNMPRRAVATTFTVLGAAICLYITSLIALRWIVSGHVPLAGGHETMVFLAWVGALMTTIVGGIVLLRQSRPTLYILMPIGLLLTGMTLMVSMMSASNPQVTNLMPVLQSPLLTLHVAIIMVAYCLLFFMMMNGLAAIAMQAMRRADSVSTQLQIERLQVISQILLYPAVFCLTIGIFIGAVWANISWGRYWGWDPKEVWALITMLIYAALFHTRSLRWLQKPMVFHTYCVIAFFAVLFTYFGVNMLLGGMHAYQ